MDKTKPKENTRMSREKMQMSHTTYCFACGKERRKTDLGYDIHTLKTYCKYACGEGHPNYPRPQIDLVPLNAIVIMDALKSIYGKYENVMNYLEKVLPRTIAVRTRPATGLYLLKYGQENSTESLNATVNAILEEYMKEHPLDHVKLTNLPWEDKQRGGFKHEKTKKAEMYDQIVEAIVKKQEEQQPVIIQNEEIAVTKEVEPKTVMEEKEVDSVIQSETPMEEKSEKKEVFYI